MNDSCLKPLLVARLRALPVTLAGGLPRSMRINKLEIGGLIDLYSSIETVGCVGVEVGCFWGESSEIAAQFFGKLYCVDTWKSYADEARFDLRMRRFNNVQKIKLHSHIAADMFKDNSIDVVYIDALHDYDNVKRDILCWFPKLRPNGWITGHDYDNMPDHKGVVLAVNEIFGKPKTQFCDSSFLFGKSAGRTKRVASLYPNGHVEPGKGKVPEE